MVVNDKAKVRNYLQLGQNLASKRTIQYFSVEIKTSVSHQIKGQTKISSRACSCLCYLTSSFFCGGFCWGGVKLLAFSCTINPLAHTWFGSSGKSWLLFWFPQHNLAQHTANLHSTLRDIALISTSTVITKIHTPTISSTQVCTSKLWSPLPFYVFLRLALLSPLNLTFPSSNVHQPDCNVLVTCP